MQRQVQLALRTVNDINLMRGGKDLPGVVAVQNNITANLADCPFPAAA